jgi:ABC-type molybdate transport system permease subunit
MNTPDKYEGHTADCEISESAAQVPVVPPKVEGAAPVLTIGLDPITAGFNAAAAFFNFLSTAQGQVICADIITLDEFFIKKIQEVFQKIHDQVQKS